MKRLIFLSLLLLVISATVKAQITVFDTYDDYVKGTGRHFDKFDGYMHFAHHYTLYFVKNHKTTGVKCRKIWGFWAGGELYRTTSKLPVRVVSCGSICYCENGLRYLDQLLDFRIIGHRAVGHKSFVSVSLKDKIYPFPRYRIPAPLKKMRTEHPEYAELFRCMKGAGQLTRVACVRDFQQSAKKATTDSTNTTNVP